MPRRRKSNPQGLPPRVYLHHGGYRYVDLTGKPHSLGRKWDMEARQKWAQLSGERPASGTRNGRAKLTLDQVLEIRGRKKDGARALSSTFNVDQKTIRDILNGKIWRQ